MSRVLYVLQLGKRVPFVDGKTTSQKSVSRTQIESTRNDSRNSPSLPRNNSSLLQINFHMTLLLIRIQINIVKNCLYQVTRHLFSTITPRTFHLYLPLSLFLSTITPRTSHFYLPLSLSPSTITPKTTQLCLPLESKRAKMIYQCINVKILKV